MLAVRFVAPTPAPVKPTDPGLEVILVNAKHNKAPVSYTHLTLPTKA